MISSFNKNAFTEENEKLFIEIIMDAVNLSLHKTKLDDFGCCLTTVLVACKSDLTLF